MIVVLSGGTGGAKFVAGLKQVVRAEDLTVIVNTGDDLRWWGLHVSPDVDSITYALAGVLSKERGWGFEGDSFRCLERMRELGVPGWFQLGDCDLATHLRRTQLLADGKTLSQATAELASTMGVRSIVLPMTDDPVETRVLTDSGELSFQEYFVRERYRVPVRGVRFAGAEGAKPAPGVIAAIREADAVFIAPSNPITSIGPILAVPGIRAALRETRAPVAAISPIVGGAAVSGPAGEMMRLKGFSVSVAGIAEIYNDFLAVLIADQMDRVSVQAEISAVPVRFTQTIMRSDEDKAALARFALEVIAPLRERVSIPRAG
ncbi:MAG TPA: 2-phospho-L-lactate transferase [Terriglobales bacterium]|nr:2-phospho-L-lactate transferase [Terriglobales bacterium]